MYHDPFTTVLQQFSLLRLRIDIQWLKAGTLPAFKGSMLHGWLGHCLKDHHSEVYDLLYGEHGNQQPKPYMVRPMQERQTEWQAGEGYYFELVLFGQTVSLASTIIAAIQQGASRGMGPARLPFSIVSVCSSVPGQIIPGIYPTHLIDWIVSRQVPALGEPCELALHWQTPVRLKQQGKLLTQPHLPLVEVCRHILRRLRQLCQFWVLDDPALLASLTNALPVLGEHHAASTLYYQDWQRYSHKAQQLLSFGGLQGQCSYQGDIGAVYPLLVVGEQLGLGGKTTFGLGQYQLFG